MPCVPAQWLRVNYCCWEKYYLSSDSLKSPAWTSTDKFCHQIRNNCLFHSNMLTGLKLFEQCMYIYPKIDVTLYPKWTVHLWNWSLARILMPWVKAVGWELKCLHWSPSFARFCVMVGKGSRSSQSNLSSKLGWKSASKSDCHFYVTMDIECHS